MSDGVGAMLVIGGGSMATAILRGAADAGVLPGRVCVVDPNAAKRAAFRESAETASDGVAWLADAEPDPGSGVVLLAVKPQVLGAVGEGLGPGGVGGRLVMSILAGVGGERVRDALGGSCRVVRVMPNTPAQIGRGTSAVAASAGSDGADVLYARRVFGGVGTVVVELDEPLIDAFTAVAGSGPAYVFYLAEAMERAAAEVGLPVDVARAVVTETVAGAAELLRQSGESPADLRARVTSKGGTTAAATGVFDGAGLAGIVERAVVAARDRGRELGRSSGG